MRFILIRNKILVLLVPAQMLALEGYVEMGLKYHPRHDLLSLVITHFFVCVRGTNSLHQVTCRM